MDYNIFNAAVEAGALLAAFIPLIYTFTKTHWKKLNHIAFFVLIISVAGEAAFGMARELLSFSLGKEDGTALLYIIQFVYSIFHIAFAASFSFYVVVSCGYLSKNNRIRIVEFWIPAMIMVIIFSTNPFHRFFYEFIWDDAVGRYELLLKSGYNALVPYDFIYALVSIILFTVFSKGVKWKKALLLWIVTGIIVIGIIIEKVFGKVCAQTFAESLGVFCLLIWLENDGYYIHLNTGLFNRLAFNEDNEVLLGAKQKYTLFCITLLNHDYISRAYDENTRVLVCNMAAAIIKKQVKNTTPYYLSNGKYAFFYFDDDELKEKAFIEKLKDSLSREFEVMPGVVIQTNWQIVVARISDDVRQVQELHDLFVGEPTGKGVIVKKTGSEIKGIKRKNEVIGAFERGIKNNNFEIFYQPIYQASTDRIISGEALLRLNDPLLGRISPTEFIPIAEESGYIKALGEFAYIQTLKFIKENKLEDLGIQALSINVSVKQFLTQDLASYYIQTAKEYGVDPSKIIIEITESDDASKSEFFKSQFNAMRAAGFCFSMDDYGTGYSNLTRIINYDLSIVKIDISILKNAVDTKGKILLRNTIKGMKAYGFGVVQEGVETEEQLNEVISYGSDFIQGFVISPPVAGKEYLEFVRNFKGIRKSGQ